MSGFLLQASLESVGIWPASIMSLPPMMEYLYSKRPRSGGPEGAGAVLIVGSAVAGAHEEARLREPADGAAEVGAVDGEDLELVAGEAADPAGDLGGFTVGDRGDGIDVVGEAGFAFGIVVDRAEGDPALVARVALERGAEEVADQRHGEDRADGAIQGKRELEEEGAASVLRGAGLGMRA